ncbi:MAG: hypothetical protein Tsb0020_45060 [Haliangiales bacterium]
MSRPRKRPQEIAQTRKHILRAAARLFASKGVAASSMQEIAEAAGYSAPSLYSYFKGKQTIIDELVTTIIGEAEALFDVTFPSGLTLRQKLELLLRHHNAWAEDHRDVFLFLVQRPPPVVQDGRTHADVTATLVGRMAAWLEANDDADELSGHSIDFLAHMLWGMRKMLFLRWVRSDNDGALNDSLSEMLDFFFYGVAGPPAGDRDAST